MIIKFNNIISSSSIIKICIKNLDKAKIIKNLIKI